jgi:predicted RNase H-like nuclease (RuvC/YqgF family)
MIAYVAPVVEGIALNLSSPTQESNNPSNADNSHPCAQCNNLSSQIAKLQRSIAMYKTQCVNAEENTKQYEQEYNAMKATQEAMQKQMNELYSAYTKRQSDIQTLTQQLSNQRKLSETQVCTHVSEYVSVDECT